MSSRFFQPRLFQSARRYRVAARRRPVGSLNGVCTVCDFYPPLIFRLEVHAWRRSDARDYLGSRGLNFGSVGRVASAQRYARALARTKGAIHHVLAFHGGIAPVARRRCPVALALDEREEISRGIAAGQSIRRIAASLGRSPSTVSREVARHGGRSSYRATEADARAWERALRPKPCRLASHPELRWRVAEKLALDWSPEQISGWLKRAFPADEGCGCPTKPSIAVCLCRHAGYSGKS